MSDTIVVDTSTGPVVVHRSGTGPALVLLHANPGDSRDFNAVLPELAPDFTVYRVDWPGYGDSPPPQPPSSATAMGYADLLVELVDRLGIDAAGYIGNSVGGYCAARLAMSQPQRVTALVLANSGGFTRDTALSRAFVRVKGSEAVTSLLVGRFSKWYLRRRTTTVREMLARDATRRGQRASIAVEAAVWRSFASPEHDLHARANHISVPTLLVWGNMDPLLGRDGYAARQLIPNAIWCPLRTGHAPFAEAPDDFLAATLPFLHTHLRPTGSPNHAR